MASGLLLLTAAAASPLISGCGGATAATSKGLPTLAINNVAVSVADTDRSVAWYRDVLGFKLASHAVPTGERRSGLHVQAWLQH